MGINTVIEEELYKKGWSFPPVKSGKFEAVKGAMCVEQSLKLLFLTNQGERIMRMEYGTDLQNFLFENLSEDFQSRIRRSITDMIVAYEPRVTLELVDITDAPEQYGKIKIAVRYRLRNDDKQQEISVMMDLNDVNGIVWSD